MHLALSPLKVDSKPPLPGSAALVHPAGGFLLPDSRPFLGPDPKDYSYIFGHILPDNPKFDNSAIDKIINLVFMRLCGYERGYIIVVIESCHIFALTTGHLENSSSPPLNQADPFPQRRPP